MPDGVDPPIAPGDEFRRLMERVRAGCPDAVEEMCRSYGGLIRVLVRRRLHRRMRAQYDSLDFLQDVWASFFRESPEKYDFDDPKALVQYLANLAFYKVTDEYRRRFRSKKYDLRREQPLETLGAKPGEPLDPPVRDPTPSQVAMAKERWERLVDGQPNPARTVLEMLRLGHTHAEIAEQTGLHRKVIQRLVRQAAQRRDDP